MKRVATLLCFGFAVGCAGHAVEPEPSSRDSEEKFGTQTNLAADIGINLSAVNYYATQLPFSNLFLNRDTWQTTDDETWNTEQADEVQVDDDGYPLEAPYRGQVLRASAFRPIHADTFEMTWQGDGELSVQGPDVEVLEEADHSLRFSASASLEDEFVFVRIERSNANNHVRAIEIHGQRDYGNAFRESLQGFGVLRFMDWAATNHSPIEHWSDRTTSKQAQGSEGGVAIEHMIETANAAHASMWFNVPHQADDDYIMRAAQLIAERLDERLQVYVEYSNENWNGIFSQVVWQQARGLEAGLDKFRSYDTADEQKFWAGMNFAVRRAGYAHNVFRRVLGERAVRVLAGQSANSGLNDTILKAYEDKRINPHGGKPDALAVAPYFGRIYNDPEEAETITVERILSEAEESIAELVARDTRENRRVANAHGVHLIAYEAGQHVLIAGGMEDTPEIVQRMVDANRSPRMGELYKKAHRAWLANGGELAVYFSSCEAPGKFGSWGAREYQDQPLAEAPKWAALNAIMME